MRVTQTGNSPVQNGDVSSTSKTEKSEKAHKAKHVQNANAAEATADVKAQLSTRAKDMAKAKAIADATPDVREQKIAELKKRIQEGRYKVDADAVADRMVDDHVRMHGIS